MPNIHSYDKHFMPKMPIPPASQASANSDWEQPFADAGYADRWVAKIFWGAVGTNITAKVTQAQDASGTGAKDVTGATLTIITAANKFATIDIGPGALDDKNGFEFVRVEVVVNGAVVWGVETSRYNIRNAGHYELDQDATYAAQIRVYD